MGMVFCRFWIYFLWNCYFRPIWHLLVGCCFTEIVKRHIYGPGPFIWVYNEVSMTFCSKVLVRTSSSLEKPLFLAIFGQFDNFRAGGHKAPIYGPWPFIWAYNQVSMTFSSKVPARTSSSLEKPLYLAIWQIWQLQVRYFWPKWSKGPFMDQDLSFEPITQSLWHSIQKYF